MLMYLVPSKFSAAMAAWESDRNRRQEFVLHLQGDAYDAVGFARTGKADGATLPTVIPFKPHGGAGGDRRRVVQKSIDVGYA